MARSKSSPNYQPTSDAEKVLNDLIARHAWMGGFRDGPSGKNKLTDLEAALWAGTYELRRLIGEVQSPDSDAPERLASLWTLLTDGILRSLVLSRGGVDWIDESDGPAD